jgi:hypothetical protein
MSPQAYDVLLGTWGVARLGRRPEAPDKLPVAALLEHFEAINGTSDDRQEIFNAPATAQALARSVGLVFDSGNLTSGPNGTLVLQTVSTGLATGQAFSEQPAVQDGFTGFLVRDDLLLTTVHGVDVQHVTDLRVIFDYQLGSVKTTFSSSEVFRVKNFEAHGNYPNPPADDWLLLRLDRGTGRPALPIASGLPAVGTEVRMFGYPLGLPMKYVSNGKVTGQAGTVFECDLDASYGNSGSPVLNPASQVVGVLQTTTPALDELSPGIYVWHWCPTGYCPTGVTGTPAFAAAVSAALT